MIKKIFTIKRIKEDIFGETIKNYNEICRLCNLDTELSFLVL